MYQELAAGWRGAADVAMLEKVRSGSIDGDQTAAWSHRLG